MSVNLKQAADDARALARTFRSVNALVDALDEVGNLEQRGKELEREAVKAQTKLDGLVAEGSNLAAALEQRKSDAIAEADGVLARARASAEKIVSNAKAAAEKAESAARDEADAARSARDTAQADLVAVSAQVSEKQSTLVDLDAKIAKAQAKIQQILGG